MKTIFTLFFLFLCLGNLTAQSLTDRKISLTATGENMMEVLTRLADRQQFDLYGSENISDTLTVRRNFTDEKLGAVLTALLADTRLGFMTFADQAVIIAPQDVLSEQWNPDLFNLAARPAQAGNAKQQTVIEIGDPDSPKTRAAQKITGQITDATTGEKLVGVTLYSAKEEKGTVTDADGNFLLELPQGVYRFDVQSIGYGEKTLDLRLFSDGNLPVELTPAGYQLDQVTVTDQADDTNIREVNIGLQTLTTDRIKELPSFLGEADVIKSLLTLPGVSTVGEGARGLNVRGGSIDQNLILQEGVPVFNSSHVLGFFSVFNPDAVRSVELYKGNVPAQFGGRLSSVLSVEIKNADNEEFKMRGGVGPVASRVTAEIPLVKQKTSLLIAGRASYSDWILRAVENEGVKNSSAQFYDVTAKLSHIFNQKSNLNASYYESRDRFVFAGEFGYGWKNRLISMRYNQLLTDKISGNIRVAYGSLRNDFFEPTGEQSFTLTNGLETYKIKPTLFFNNFAQHKITTGAEWTRYRGRDEILEKRTDESFILPDRAARDRGDEYAAFINDEWTVADFLSLSLGLRYVRFSHLGANELAQYAEGRPISEENIIGVRSYDKNEVITTYGGWEPRVAAAFQLGANNSIKLSYNRSAQYIHLISNTTVPTPVDIWQVSTPYIPPQRAHNFSVGYFQNLRRNKYEFSAEAYYRDIENLIDYRDFAELLLEDNLETQLLVGEGIAYGTELFLRKNGGKVNGQISYTYSRSLRRVRGDIPELTVNAGELFPSAFDQPHSVKATLKTVLGKRSDLTFNFVYNSGRPVTVPFTQYYLGTLIVPQYSERNGFRIPDYHRLDLAWTFRPNALRRKKYKDSFTFSLYNVYARRNAFSVYFERADLSTTQAFRLSVLGTVFPALTYNFELN